MYINNEERKAKIGRVSLSVRNGSIRIRFTYPTNTKEDLTVLFKHPLSLLMRLPYTVLPEIA
jgi:hypothetical protein